MEKEEKKREAWLIVLKDTSASRHVWEPVGFVVFTFQLDYWSNMYNQYGAHLRDHKSDFFFFFTASTSTVTSDSPVFYQKWRYLLSALAVQMWARIK